MTGATSPTVDVAVISWNTRALLGRCLSSLRDAAERGLAHVTVVDNGSSDGSSELVRSEYTWAKLIEPRENLGFGAAVNLAAEAGSSTWVAAANADIALEPEALSEMVAAGERDPSAGAIAPRLILPDGTTQHSVHRFPSPALAATVGLGLPGLSARLAGRLLLEGAWNPELPARVDWAHGAFLLFRRSSFESIRGFDARQWMYAEDLDICWRLRRAGHQIAYVPTARVRHELSAATEQAFLDREQRHLAASYRWLTRRRGRWTARLTAHLNAAGALRRAAVLAVGAAFSPSRWRNSMRRARRYARLHRSAYRESTSPERR